MNPFKPLFKSSPFPPEIRIGTEGGDFWFTQGSIGDNQETPCLFVKTETEFGDDGRKLDDLRIVSFQLSPQEALELGKLLTAFGKVNKDKYEHLWKGNIAAQREHDRHFELNYKPHIEKLRTLIPGPGPFTYPDTLEAAVKALERYSEKDKTNG
jgi:hypothetical protein